MPVTPLEPQRAVEPGAMGDVVVLTVQGCLDDAAGAALVRAAGDAVGDDVARVDIDLCSITGYTQAGAQWLVRCRRLSDELPEGLHYRTGRGPGREALLAAYADEPA